MSSVATVRELPCSSSCLLSGAALRSSSRTGRTARGGAAFALAPHRARGSKTFGAAYGLALWALFETVIAPVAGADREGPLQERAALAADHILFGLVLTSGR